MRIVRSLSGVFIAVLLTVLSANQVLAQAPAPSAYAGLQWRSIGPYRGGRSVAATGVDQRPGEFYFGATGGGLWKTTDGGQEWTCVSDGYFTTASVGAVAVAPSNPDIVYAGTGEGCIRGDISHGDGIYRSDDAGATWSHIGLVETQTIPDIIIHPTDPNTVYVASLGHIYGPNPERGVYKTTDGGRTWDRILFQSEKAGAVDLSMDPSNPDVLYAATWEAWRTGYTMNSGGPGSRLYKTTDGGKTWTDLSRNPGLPKGTLGRIGVDVSPADPNRVWALVESLDGGFFRSDDGGKTWTLLNDDRNYRQRAWYYTHVTADPKDRDTVYVLNTGLYRSEDGGTAFRSLRPQHGDNHHLWIAPSDPQRMIETNDGGANVSVDGGQTWTDEDIPTGQFYHVTTDNAFPYRILGAQQDNSTARIVSRTQGPGIGDADWTGTAGGESGYIAVKPNDPDVVYGGSYGGLLQMVNHRTGEGRNVNIWPDNPMGWAAGDIKERFQWTFPIVYSPHDPNLLYASSQHLFKTTNGGETWKQISPDLTRADPATLGPSGGPITKDNTAVEYYATIFSVAESPLRPGLIWTGSDDGLVYISQDAGGSWTQVTPEGMPKWGLVSMLEASSHDEGAAYLAIDNHENDDYGPYAYRTHDYGKTWTRITTGIPGTTFFRVIREDPEVEGLLYGGTEMGAFISFDDGDHWQPLKMNLPLTPVHDLTVKDGDLIAATHGRGFWILDDLSAIRQMAADGVPSGPHLFDPPDAYRVSWGGGGFGGGRGGFGGGSASPMGANPMSGIVLTYYLPSGVDQVTFTLTDPWGDEVAMLSSGGTRPTGQNAGGGRGGQGRGGARGPQVSAEAGIHRLAISPSYQGSRGFEGMILWAAGRGGAQAPPGIYTVTMNAGGRTESYKVHYMKDPRISATEDDLVAQFELSRKIVDRTNDANDAVVIIRDIKQNVDQRVEASGNNSRLRRDGDALKEKLSAVEAEIYQVKNRSGQDPLNYPIKLNNKIAGLLGVVQSGDFRPTDQSYAVFADLSAQLQVQLEALHKILTDDLAAYNDRLARANQERITPIDPAAQARGGGR